MSHRALAVPPDVSIKAKLLEDIVTVELNRPGSKAIVFTQVLWEPTGSTGENSEIDKALHAGALGADR